VFFGRLWLPPCHKKAASLSILPVVARSVDFRINLGKPRRANSILFTDHICFVRCGETTGFFKRIGKTKTDFKGQGGVSATWNRCKGQLHEREQLLAMIVQ
jgi:hypothetical protein